MRKLILILCLAFPRLVAAQETDCRWRYGAGEPGSAEFITDYARATGLLQDSLGWLIQRPSNRTTMPCNLLWTARPRNPLKLGQMTIEVEPVIVDQVYNSGYPRTARDGLLWAGKGASIGATGGVFMQWGVLTAALKPAVAYQQNGEFPIVVRERPGLSDFAYPWYRRIDWPQRFGDGSFTSTSLGQSVLRADVGPAHLGISTENLRWGPAMLNPIIMNNSAPGFPQLFWGVDQWRTRIGTIGGEVVWGQLRESEYYDDNPANDESFFAGLVLSYQPAGLDGLSVGGSRVFVRQWPRKSFSLGQLFPFFRQPFAVPLVDDNGTTEDFANQILSFYGRYAMAGFELYGEWARNDHSANFDDFVLDPHHSQGYMLGFQHMSGGETRRYRVRAELTSLLTRTNSVRTVPPWYTRRQGYTNKGQLLGSLGPGGDSRYFGIDRFTARGRNGIFIHHARYDEDTFHRIVAPVHVWTGHDAELTFGTENYFRFGSFDISGLLSYSSRRNRNFRQCNETQEVFTIYCYESQYQDKNLQASVGAVWYPR